ncbi:MAG: Acanthocystis turfacea chlorella virus 1 [Bacillota bacterium]|jgi:hypothetical protein
MSIFSKLKEKKEATLAKKYINHVQHSLANAEHNISKLNAELLLMPGMTGKKTRHFYNNLLSMEHCNYLEIGTWQGSSFCSALYKNKINATSIDNWSEFQGPKNEFLQNLKKYTGENKVKFIESDCWDVNPKKLSKFNVYLYDGPHNYDDQYKALKHFLPCLKNTFIFIVDDWNWDYVRNGTFDAIRDLKLNVAWQHEIRLTHDNSHTPEPLSIETWWNGLYVAVLQKP